MAGFRNSFVRHHLGVPRRKQSRFPAATDAGTPLDFFLTDLVNLQRRARDVRKLALTSPETASSSAKPASSCARLLHRWHDSQEVRRVRRQQPSQLQVSRPRNRPRSSSSAPGFSGVCRSWRAAGSRRLQRLDHYVRSSASGASRWPLFFFKDRNQRMVVTLPRLPLQQ